MKKCYLRFVLPAICTLQLVVKAQSPVTITTANMPGQNDTIRYSTANPLSVDVNLTGANYTWNFDTLSPIGQGLYEYKSALLTPYTFYFIGLNKYGLKISDTVGFGIYTFTEVYNFYKNSSNNFQTEGIGFKYSGIPLAAYYADQDEIYTFPLNFSDRDSTTFAFSVQLGAGITYTQKGYRINQVDGWGKIKTPFDSANCLRLISTTFSRDSINYSGFGFSFPNNQRSYKWLSTTQKIPMLEVSGPYNNNAFVPAQLRYRDKFRNLTGIPWLERENEAFSIYPNPAGEMLYVKCAATAFRMELTDISGRVVLSQEKKETEEITIIQTSALAEGCYFVNVIDPLGKYSVQKKIVIVR